MADKTKINLGLQLANFQEFRRNLLDALGDVHKLSTEFQGVDTDVKVIEKTLSGVNKVISILTTKVSADGKMSVATAKELRQILADLNKNSLSLSDSEQSRLDPNSFRAKMKFLTDENSVLAKNLATYEEQTAELEKQEKLLEKQTKISSYLKGKKGVSDDIKTIAGNFTDEQLRTMVTPTGSKGEVRIQNVQARPRQRTFHKRKALQDKGCMLSRRLRSFRKGCTRQYKRIQGAPS